MSDKRSVILFVEGNLDGTVGGSHHCLLEIVKSLNPGQFEIHTLFHHNHALVPQFQNFSTVHIFPKTRGIDISQLLPAVGTRLHPIFLPLQRAWNFAVHKTALFLRARRLLRSLRANIIHINNAPTPNAWLFAALTLRIPITAHLRGFWLPSKFQEFWVKKYNRVIAISHAVLDLLEQHVRFPNAVVIHDGIDSSAIRLRAQQGPADGFVRNEENAWPVLLIAGNITRWKGQLVACEAIPMLRRSYPKIALHVVGSVSNAAEDSTYVQGIRNFIAVNDLERQIILQGYSANVPALMSISDIVLHTSIEPEPLGRVILEAMALGKPVVATNLGGPREILTDRTDGLLVAPDDPTTLASSISLLCEDPKLREALGQNAEERVTFKFELAAKVKVLADIWLVASEN